MTIIINNSSQVPIYEQISRRVKELIASGELIEGAPLPSVRMLAKEL
ncbi:MAG: GntR family transcriptional regulator, partial [Clostridia bacterium]|nr:GntR family transcriptional regulator [Clostridia bacterium]